MNPNLHTLVRNCRLLKRHLRYGHPFNRRRRIQKRLAVLETLFRTVNAYLRRLEVEYWLADGTLLGYYRCGGILAHDTDVDFAVPEAGFEVIRRNRSLLPAGYTMYDTGYRHRGPKLYVTCKGWEADLYFFEDLGDSLLSYAPVLNKGLELPFPREVIYPLRETDFLGETTYIPHQVEDYLEQVYGYIGEDAVYDRTTKYWYKKSS